MMPRHIAAQLLEREHPLQKELVRLGMARIKASERRFDQRHEDWRENERLIRAFRAPDAQDHNTRAQELTKGVQKIVVPYSYAVIQSALSFLMTVFTQRKPIIPVEGLGPGDVRAAILHEQLLDYQVNSMLPNGNLVLYQWFFDALRYGVGIVKNLWTIREWPDLVRTTVPQFDAMGNPTAVVDTLEERDVIAYEGNEWSNVSPFDFYPDPQRSLGDFQRGEFVSHRFRTSWVTMEQKAAEGMYVGLEYVSRQQDMGEGMHRGSDLAGLTGMSDPEFSGNEDQRAYPSCDELWMYVHPDDMGLTAKTEMRDEDGVPATRWRTPRLWVFTYANQMRCIRAEPANLPGRRFPFEAIEPNFDLHAPANVSMIETFRGLDYIMSWLINSRLQNVRKTLNNQWVYDPSMVEEQDILSEDPGQLIRLKRQHWQSGAVKDAVFPIPVQDVTQTHVSVDTPVVRNLIEYVTGVNNLSMGVGNTGRRAATEIQAIMQSSSGRMKTMVELFANQGLRPLAEQMTRNNQTFLDEQVLALREPYAKMFGQPALNLTPQMLAGTFLFPFGEGGIPTDKQQEVATLKEMIQMGMQAGAPMPPIPWNALWARFLWQMGFKDLSTYGMTVRDIAVTPDEQVQAQMQQGNLAPVPGMPGGSLNGMPTAVPSDGFAMPSNGTVPNA